ncbi:MAG: hypothetical protein V4724_06065 [Pseudomonadota bacterium]
MDGALEAIAHAYDVLSTDGVVLLVNVNGIYLGDAVSDPVMAELNRRRAVTDALAAAARRAMSIMATEVSGRAAASRRMAIPAEEWTGCRVARVGPGLIRLWKSTD